MRMMWWLIGIELAIIMGGIAVVITILDRQTSYKGRHHLSRAEQRAWLDTVAREHIDWAHGLLN